MFKMFRGRRRLTTRERKPEYPFYPHHVIRNLMAVLGAIAILSALAGWYPAPLERIANPIELSPPESFSPPMWLLRPAWLLENILPVPGLSTIILAVALVLCLLIPVLDHSEGRRLKERLPVAIPFLLWLVYLFVSTWLIPGRFLLP